MLFNFLAVRLFFLNNNSEKIHLRWQRRPTKYAHRARIETMSRRFCWQIFQFTLKRLRFAPTFANVTIRLLMLLLSCFFCFLSQCGDLLIFRYESLEPYRS